MKTGVAMSMCWCVSFMGHKEFRTWQDTLDFLGKSRSDYMNIPHNLFMQLDITLNFSLRAGLPENAFVNKWKVLGMLARFTRQHPEEFASFYKCISWKSDTQNEVYGHI
jgi:hypothetical protein